MPAQEVVIGLHLYQPPRRAHHRQFSGRLTDPQGIDWTKKIFGEAYLPQLQAGILDVASFDILGTLHRELETIDSGNARKIGRAMKEYGVGEPYLHPILPDLSNEDKRILIAYGFRRFHDKAGKDPLVFWPPETAIDTATLEVLATVGYRAFICAPEQIVRNDRRADNLPTKILLRDGKSIIALPFDRPVSGDLAFHPKTNADDFVRDVILPALQRVPQNGQLLAWTDDETFGHHKSDGGVAFLQHLLFHALQNRGLAPVPVNELIRSLSNPGVGRIRERTAWSCPHGDLVRWHGECGCHMHEHKDLSWKGPFYAGLHSLNGFMSKLLEDKLGQKYQHQLESGFEKALENKGGRGSSHELSLLSAKASSLAAVTSCGTFFASPHTSGRINALLALQSLQHLRDAGLDRAAESGLEIVRSNMRKKANLLTDNGPHNPFNDLLR